MTTGEHRAIPVGRLAPSPTGAQHVGNARTFLLAWLAVRARGGTVILRVEDIDSPRVKAWAVSQALADLRWLGLDWDEGPDCGGPHSPYVQTERIDLYNRALDVLRRAERVYPCTCSRRDVAAAASAPHIGQEPPPYPGTCAGRSAGDAKRLEGRPFVWRFRVMENDLQFLDGVAGPQRCGVVRELGDFVLARADGAPSYQLAVVVDDHAMGITEVLRGDDLLPSTFRQLELYRALGWEAPQFAHVPLVVGPDGRRLAKRHGDTRLALLREAGQGPERLLGTLAWSCGLQSEPHPTTAAALLVDFRLDQLPRGPFVLSADLWQNFLEGPA
ncbi:MAG: tRNA glutamyl-Q(34) synthetase GluQRS [Pirellulaceae bacterium]